MEKDRTQEKQSLYVSGYLVKFSALLCSTETNKDYEKLLNNILLQIKSFLWVSPDRQLLLEKFIVWSNRKHSKNSPTPSVFKEKLDL